MDSRKKSFIIQTLRRGTYRWVGRWQAEKRSKVGRNQYVCENPECGQILGKKDTQLDHIAPVVDPEKGFTTFDEYIDRMYCYAEGYQRLCIECHQEKTLEENSRRKK